MAFRDLQTVVYTDDETNQYAMKIDKHLFLQETGDPAERIIGGADYAGTTPLPPMPTNLKPRHVIVANGTNRRKVICLDPDAPLYLGSVTTVSLQQLGSAAAVYTRSRKKGEDWKRRGSPGD